MTAKGIAAIVTLTTDFGRDDHYAGVLHGVILGINPRATVVDLCHGVPAQDIAAGSFILESGTGYFPPGAVHVAIVDPSVGSERAALALRTAVGCFVAPDNGLLSGVLRKLLPSLPSESCRLAGSSLPADVQAIALTNPRYWLPSVSVTFHGRDLFAPVAAHISLGRPFERLGEPAQSIHLLPVPRPERRSDGVLIAHVRYVDRFGNLITDLSAEQAVGLGGSILLRIRGRSVPGLYKRYSDGPPLLALIGSSGAVEIAARDGSAAGSIGAKVGDDVVVVPSHSDDLLRIE